MMLRRFYATSPLYRQGDAIFQSRNPPSQLQRSSERTVSEQLLFLCGRHRRHRTPSRNHRSFGPRAKRGICLGLLASYYRGRSDRHQDTHNRIVFKIIIPAKTAHAERLGLFKIRGQTDEFHARQKIGPNTTLLSKIDIFCVSSGAIGPCTGATSGGRSMLKNLEVSWNR